MMRRRVLLIQLGLAVCVLLVYGQVAGFEFLGLDDPGYVTQNPRVAGGLSREGLAWAFTTTAQANWHPLTWLSLMLDAQVGGSDPRVFHLTNLVLHLASTLLLFRCLLGATGAVWRSAFVAAVFALHPLHVESVAWVAERKDVLSGLFGVWTLAAYLRYARRPRAARYALLATIFALGLLAKPMLVSLPIILLLLDYWPLGRLDVGGRGFARELRRLIVEKLPLFLLAAASSALTVWAQHRGGAIGTLEAVPFGARLANAVVSCVWYARKTFWPSGLAVPYPYPASWPGPSVVVACAALLLIMTWFALSRARRSPYLVVGWAWYGVMLIPVIGLVQVGMQPRADRYTYLPMVGICIAVSWGAHELSARWIPSAPRRPVALATGGGLAVAVLASATFMQLGHWRNSEALFSRALRVTGDNAVARNGLGLVLLETGRLEPAIEHFREAVRIQPGYAEAHTNLGAALAKLGSSEEALAHYREAVRLRPDDPTLRTALGAALIAQGKWEEAKRTIPATSPARADALALKLDAAVLAREGKDEEAIARFREALRIEPADVESLVNLGLLLMRRGDLSGARTQLESAVQIRPDHAPAQRTLAVVLAREGNLREAITHFEAAVRLDPSDEAARRNLERARALIKEPR
jgi:Flp pilus assembly protein TadD